MRTELYIPHFQCVQNRCMKIILRCDRSTPVFTMLNTCKMRIVKQTLCYNALMYIYIVKNSLLPHYIRDTVSFNCETCSYILRNADNFDVPRSKTTIKQNTLFHKGVQSFKPLLTDIKTCDNIMLFKRKLKDMS